MCKMIKNSSKCVALFLAFAFVSAPLFAQVAVNATGKAILGRERAGNDWANEVTVEVLGTGTDAFRTGSRISFGDYASSPSGAHAYIGEARSSVTGDGYDDTDALQINGRRGIYFTTMDIAGTATVNTMKLTTSGDLYIRGALFQNQSNITSDIRLKKNVKPLIGALALVLQLQGIRYDFTPLPLDPKIKEELDKAQPKDEKEQKALAENKKAVEKMTAVVPDQIGFSAQEIQKVLPGAIATGDSGYLSVNYAAILPVLTEAIKEQQVQIETLKKEIEELKKKVK
jgi:Chaperone of endosialidase